MAHRFNMATIAHEKRVRVVALISESVDRAVEIESAKQGVDKREFIERALKAALRERRAA